jgi:alpha-tubulin suppressor-like RCC1 family protein
VACWGNAIYGQVGTGTWTALPNSPALVEELPEVVDIETGSAHTCAITSEGAAWCWGSNAYGQLGTGEINEYPSHIEQSPVEVVVLTAIESMSLGGAFSCAMTTEDESVQCWGSNSHGKLGDGTEEDSLTPVPVELEDVLEVDAGWLHACALNSTRGLWCWGSNSQGQLGDNSTDHRATPVGVIFPEEE